MKILIVYIPVLHQGYLDFFDKYRDADELWILGDWLESEFKEIKKDIRRLDPQAVKQAIEGLKAFKAIKVVDKKDFSSLTLNPQPLVVMPEDELFHALVAKYFSKAKVTYAPVFLRWDKHRVLSKFEPMPSLQISKDKFDKKIMSLALGEASKSIDWWRQVGGILVKDKRVLLAGFNKHLPTEHESYFHNDMRSLFSKGKYIELLVSIHAEANLIAAAAKKGIKLDGSDMYVTLFPCPICSKQIAQAGIKRLFYFAGYSLTDGESILKNAGVELIKVDISEAEQKKLEKQSEIKSILKKYK